MSRGHLQGERDRFAPEVRRYGGSARIAPPGIADYVLAGEGETD
jgi:hypothetical protein